MGGYEMKKKTMVVILAVVVTLGVSYLTFGRETLAGKKGQIGSKEGIKASVCDNIIVQPHPIDPDPLHS